MVSVANYSEDYTLLKRIAGDQINVILSNEVVAKIISQTCRQPGLSLVYSEILSFNGKSHYKDITGPWYEEASGDEIYFSNQSEIIGKRYDKVQLSYNSSSVIGIFNSEKGVILNPHSDYLLKEGDQVIVIAQDADKIDYLLNDDSIIDENLIVNKKSYLEPEKILIINSNRLTSLIITKLDKYVIDGSSIDLFNHNNEQLEKEKMNINNLENASINFMSGDPTVYNELEKINLMQYDHIVVLSDFINHGAMNADARNLITLLHARDILRKSDRKITIVSQMMDERNRAVADQARADDFIISEKLISQYLAQISENQFLFPLFNELFTNEGAEIYFNNIKDYVKIGVKTNFYTLVKAASLRNESAIGYRKSALHYDAGANYGVKMNPDKDEEILIDSDDQLIIIASASR